VSDQFDAFFNPKNASEKNAKNITPSTGQLEKRASSRATDVVWHRTLATMATNYIPTDLSL